MFMTKIVRKIAWAVVSEKEDNIDLDQIFKTRERAMSWTLTYKKERVIKVEIKKI